MRQPKKVRKPHKLRQPLQADSASQAETVTMNKEASQLNAVVVGGCDEQLPLGLDGLALHGVLGDVSLLREKGSRSKFYSLPKGFL